MGSPQPGAVFGVVEVYRPGTAVHSFGAIPLCVSGVGSIRITGLQPEGGDGGLEIVDFAARTLTPGTFGASRQSLAQEGFPALRVVDVPCADKGEATELGLSVQRVGPGNGRFTSLRVSYDTAGEHRRLTVAFRLKLCGPSGRTPTTCGSADTP